MEIHVTQYMRPSGRQKSNSVEGMPDHLGPILKHIKKAGLTIEAEVLLTGDVSFTLACHKYATDYDIEICENGPGESGTKAGLTRLLERFDKKRFTDWLREQKNADDGCGVGWGT